MSINFMKESVWGAVSNLANEGSLTSLVRLDLIVSYESAVTFKDREALRGAIRFYSSDQEYIAFLESQGLGGEG
tara:strand:- start:2789 stop:3010 length:222 start_codon:yes stop_codon:yes gene_type:complete